MKGGPQRLVPLVLLSITAALAFALGPFMPSWGVVIAPWVLAVAVLAAHRADPEDSWPTRVLAGFTGALLGFAIVSIPVTAFAADFRGQTLNFVLRWVLALGSPVAAAVGLRRK